MDKTKNESGESQIERSSERESDNSIVASGDAIILSEAIHQLASSFREVASAIFSATNTEPAENDQIEVERYLDGSRIKK